MTTPIPPQQAAHWRDRLIANSEVISDALYSFQVRMICYSAMQRPIKPIYSYEHIISFLKEY